MFHSRYCFLLVWIFWKYKYNWSVDPPVPIRPVKLWHIPSSLIFTLLSFGWFSTTMHFKDKYTPLITCRIATIEIQRSRCVSFIDAGVRIIWHHCFWVESGYSVASTNNVWSWLTPSVADFSHCINAPLPAFFPFASLSHPPRIFRVALFISYYRLSIMRTCHGWGYVFVNTARWLTPPISTEKTLINIVRCLCFKRLL